MLTRAVWIPCIPFLYSAHSVTHTYLQSISKQDYKVLQIEHQVGVVTVWLQRQRNMSDLSSRTSVHVPKMSDFAFSLCVLQSASSGQRWFWTAPAPKAPPRTLYWPNPESCEGRDPPQQRSWMEGSQQHREGPWEIKRIGIDAQQTVKQECSSAGRGPPETLLSL